MNAQMLAASSGLEDPWRRLAWVIPFSVSLWAALLTLFGLLLERTASPPPAVVPAELRIVELPPAGLQGGSAVPKPATPAKAKIEVPKPHRRVRVRRIVPPVRVHALRHEISPPLLPPSPLGTAKESPQVTKSGPAVATPGTTAKATGIEGGSGAGTGAGLGSDSGGARAIYAPKPTIPDSLREEPFQTVAVAHFRVSYTGQVQVTLITPTESPELNQILLDTLKQWRFFPAMRSGVSVDSQFDVRIPIKVE
jgi:periplasmic protein TonB